MYVLRGTLNGLVRFVMSPPLFAEHEGVLSRPETHAYCPLSKADFLNDEGIFDEVHAGALKGALADPAEEDKSASADLPRTSA